MNKLTLLLFLSIITQSIWGNARIVKHYTINDGLANNAVYSITQDRKGKMWFGTIDGLHNYDGNEIRVWRDANIKTLGSNIYAINEDSNEVLWVGSEKGLSLFNLKTERFTTFDEQTEAGIRINTPVGRIITDSNQNIWIATAGQGVFRYEITADKLTQYTSPGKINSDFITSLLLDKSGTLWIATRNAGISRYNPTLDLFQEVNQCANIRIISLLEDYKGNIWVGSGQDGLFLLDKSKMELTHKLKPQSKKHLFQIRSMVEWESGELFLASDEGLMRYNTLTGDTQTFSSTHHFSNQLNDNHLQTLFIDKDKSLWIGTYFGGVNYIPSFTNNFQHYNNENTTIKARYIGVIAEADDNNLWIGSDDDGFYHWDRVKNHFTTYNIKRQGSFKPSYHNIHALLQDDDKLYIGMYLGGLDILDLKTGEYTNHKSGKSINSLYASGVYALYKDSLQQIWVGTNGGLNKYRPHSDDFERVNDVYPADVSYIIEDKSNNLWVCSFDNGIFRYDKTTNNWHHYADKEDDSSYTSPIPTNKIITAEVAWDGTLWVGTDGDGLLKFDYDNLVFNKVDLPPYIRVIQKIIAHGTELWITTSNGMYCYNPLNGMINGYNKYDGLQENQFLPNSGLRLSDGTIFVGGINGFNEFHPNHIIHNNQHSTLILSDFQIFNKPVKVSEENSPLTTSITYTDALTLKHDHSIFSLTVADLNYINPSKGVYKYKLDGFEKEWTITNIVPHVTYTNLPSGRYTFLVSSSNGNDIWAENVISLPIKILPPWWGSYPAIVVYVLLVIAALVCFYIYMLNKQKKKLALLSMEKDKEIYQNKIDFFTHMVHEIRTPLTLILSPLENVMNSRKTVRDEMPQLQIIERNGKRLLNLVNQLMDFRKVEAGGMKLKLINTNITDTLRTIYQRFELSAKLKNIEVVLTTPSVDCYAFVDQEAFIKIVSNLLTNALKFTSTHIWIELNLTQEKKIELRIKDNGRGIALEEREMIFAPFYQIRESRPSDNIGTGVGLLLVKTLVDMMNGELKLESEVGIGSVFTVAFAQSTSAVLNHPCDEIVIEARVNAIKEKTEDVDFQHKILIVDDNQDLLDFLRILLSPIYKTECVLNAKSALPLTEEFMPDIIISDIMMPDIDGIEFCRMIKQNLKTSHIPVILLTAKVETGDYVLGLENGADFYITKPFSAEVIKAQISSLLMNRERLRGSFKTIPTISAVSVASNKLDKIFIDRVSDIIDARITDSDFTVDVLAFEAGISRTGLFTKIKAITGMTPNDYIRIIRLKKAAHLLSTQDLQINEVCYQIGFSSPSYFAKCFQAQFGISPIEFKRSSEVDQKVE